MKKQWYTKKLVSLVLVVSIVLATGGLSYLVLRAAASAETAQSDMGIPFPSDFSPDSVESDYSLSTAEELVRFADAAQTYDFAGVTIHLAADIDYSDGYEGVSFSGIGTVAAPFCGTFDGHGYTVSNLYSTYTGMFHIIGSTENPATIRNLTLDGATISGPEGRAVLVSRFIGNPKDETANNRIENVTVSNSTGSFTGNNCGILVGRCLADDQAITISGCAVTNCDMICTTSSTTNVSQWGAIIGKDRSLGYSRIENCTVTATNIRSSECNLDRVGLVAGQIYGAAKINGCTVVTSSITAGLATDVVTQEIGGIVGRLQSGYAAITNCTVATTKITTAGACQYVGLLAGRTYGGTIQNNTVTQSTIDAQFADASVQANGIGGLIGYVSGNAAAVDGCKVSRITVSTASRGNALGGLVGSVETDAAGTAIRNSSIANSYLRTTWAEDAQSSTALGGVIGQSLGNVTAQAVDVVNTQLSAAGAVKHAGAFAGLLGGDGGASVTDCSVRLCAITAEGLSQYVGLLAGHLYGGTLKNNKAADSAIELTYNASNSQASRIGGLIGCVSSNPVKMLDCSGENIAIRNASRVNSIGGLIGNIESTSAGSIINDCALTELTMENTYSTNSANSFYIGGAIGRSLGKVHVTNVSVEGASITAASLVQGMGGFAGYLSGSDPSVLTGCSVNEVTITQTQAPLDDSYQCYHVAGFVGCVDSPSKLAGCSVTDTSVTMQGRVYYLAGLIGSTYSDVLQTTPVNAAVTVKNCAVKNFAFGTKQSRNCNEFGGLIGWLSEGGTVTDCYISGVTNPSNTNSVHVGGLIGYISESTTDSVNSTVKNCYVENCALNGKTFISATIGNAVATSKVLTNNHYYNCTLNGGTESNSSGAAQVTTTDNLTNGTLVTGLNTTAGTAVNSGIWTQGTGSPVLNENREAYTEVKVMCYNIYYLTQNDSYPISDRQNKVIDMIDECYNSGVGVIGLQEVTAVWYDYINAYVKNENTNLAWCGYGRYGGTFGGFASGTNDSGDAFSLILFDKTKFDKTGEGHFWLSDTPTVQSAFYTLASNYRVVNWIKLRSKTTGEEFVFLNAHLEETQSASMVNRWGYTIDSSSGPAVRVKQAQLICDQMAEHANGLPVILVGDWNSYAGTDGYSTIMSNGYQDLRKIAETADSHGSYNAWTRTDLSKFASGDHIVASELCTAILYDVLAEEDVDAATGYHISDHSPMIAIIRY